ncbi:MAG: hypothetical protein HYX24_02210 [Candidatus Aenigmarchaeota archaeon]|nr:hypothetical protein [Candidatus Aenigmarchaeota archaeon]
MTKYRPPIGRDGRISVTEEAYRRCQDIGRMYYLSDGFTRKEVKSIFSPASEEERIIKAAEMYVYKGKKDHITNTAIAMLVDRQSSLMQAKFRGDRIVREFVAYEEESDFPPIHYLRKKFGGYKGNLDMMDVEWSNSDLRKELRIPEALGVPETIMLGITYFGACVIMREKIYNLIFSRKRGDEEFYRNYVENEFRRIYGLKLEPDKRNPKHYVVSSQGLVNWHSELGFPDMIGIDFSGVQGSGFIMGCLSAGGSINRSNRSISLADKRSQLMEQVEAMAKKTGLKSTLSKPKLPNRKTVRLVFPSRQHRMLYEDGWLLNPRHNRIDMELFGREGNYRPMYSKLSVDGL